MMFVFPGLGVYTVLCFLLCVVSLCVLCILLPMSASLDFVAKCFSPSFSKISLYCFVLYTALSKLFLICGLHAIVTSMNNKHFPMITTTCNISLFIQVNVIWTASLLYFLDYIWSFNIFMNLSTLSSGTLKIKRLESQII